MRGPSSRWGPPGGDPRDRPRTVQGMRLVNELSTARREGVEYQCERWEELLVHGVTQIKAKVLQESINSVSRQIYRVCTSISSPKSLFRMLS